MALPPDVPAAPAGRRTVMAPVVASIVGLAVLLTLQLTLNRAFIETRLRERAGDALARSGIPGITPSVQGRDVTLTGTSVAPGELQLATTTVGAVDGVRRTVADDRLRAAAREAEQSPEPAANPDGPAQLTATIERGRITLTGAAPSAEHRDRLLAAAAQVVGRAEVVDSLRLARGADPRGVAALVAAVAALDPAANGSVDLVDGVISLFGRVPRQESHDAVVSAAGQVLGDPTRVVDQLAVEADPLPAEAVEAERALSELPDITFPPGLVRLDTRGLETLGQAAGILLGAPQLRVRVEGRPDPTGPAPDNARLAQDRAAAAREALIQAGLAPERVEAVGYSGTGPQPTPGPAGAASAPATSPATPPAGAGGQLVLTVVP